MRDARCRVRLSVAPSRAASASLGCKNRVVKEICCEPFMGSASERRNPIQIIQIELIQIGRWAHELPRKDLIGAKGRS